MKFNIKAAAITCGVVWCLLAMLMTGVANWIWPGYGQSLLDLMASLYPGYQGTPSLGQVIIGAVYGLVDGTIAGAVFAWIYNRLVAPAGQTP